MNILYIPQLSMYDKNTGSFIPQADGNLNMMRNFINEWKRYRKEDYFYILLPYSINHWVDGIEANRTILRYNQYVTSARVNRYNFPINEILMEIRGCITGKIDLVICDVPELSRNIIAMFEVILGYSPKIMSNIKHVDDPLEELNKYHYWFRLFDGIECSDYVTILSDSMKYTLYNAMGDFLNNGTRENLIEKVSVFEPSVSITELHSHTIDLSFIYHQNKKVITFPGRLSVGEERRTNWDKFFHAIIELRNTREDFVVYFTDPNNSLTLVNPWIKTIKKDRYQFINLLYKTDIIVSLMDIQGFGGISIREALIFGCLPVVPYKHEYIQMNHPEYEGFIHGNITVEKLVEKLNWALDNCNARSVESIQDIGKKFSIECQMPSLMKQMEVILNE